IACGNCHTSIGWKPLRAVPEFNHNRETKYPLKGMHTKVECAQCHANMIFQEASTRCADCHADIHRRQLGARCEDCHTVKGWAVKTQAVRQHSARFPLMGAHAAVDCEGCHKGGGAAQYTALSTASDRKGWAVKTQAVRQHSARFPLMGAHAAVDCEGCHKGGGAAQYTALSTACASC